VPAGNSLTIAPGTTLLFIGHFFFNVYGTLTANGTVTDSIKFLREEPLEEYRWGGIRFYSIGSVNSISYTKIDNAKNITTPNYNGGGIYAFGATVNVSHSKITNCQASYGGGVYASESAILNLTDCLFYNNTASNGAGLFLYNYVTSTIRDCMIGKNSSTGT
jgi:hypothetical protein